MNKKNYDRAIEEIKSFARANGCEISRFSVQDILQMDCPDIREEEIEKGILALNQEGIHVITENDEDYEAADGDVLGEMIAAASCSGAQIVLETHSDHILNDIRLAVKKKHLAELGLK